MPWTKSNILQALNNYPANAVVTAEVQGDATVYDIVFSDATADGVTLIIAPRNADGPSTRENR